MNAKQKAAHERALEKIREAQKERDTEAAHGNADDALCEFLRALGHRKIVSEWEAVRKWCA